MHQYHDPIGPCTNTAILLVLSTNTTIILVLSTNTTILLVLAIINVILLVLSTNTAILLVLAIINVILLVRDQAVGQVLGSDTYLLAAQRMQRLSREGGGADGN